MNPERLLWLLRYVDNRFAWPMTATTEERTSLVDLGFAFEDETGAVHLTSLGELELGYPETKGNINE